MTAGARRILGWDVGGANVKVAVIDGQPHGGPVIERPFALWRDPDRLPSVLAALADRLGRAPAMAVTMTAELADCFAAKRDGVKHVIDAFEAAFPASALWIYGIDGQFRSAADARARPHEVAAANWLAGATLVARIHPDALFIDAGSTTTDIIPIAAGHVAVSGRTDAARLGSGELVYTGCLRTPVCAIVRSVPLGTGWCRVAAEHFAVVADVYRWCGRITDEEYTCETPDGRGRSRADAGARLARMVCADREMLADDEITAIAEHVARAQTRQIRHGVRQVLRRLAPGRPTVAVVAGCGGFLATAAAAGEGLQTRDLAVDLGPDAARSTPAAAVAWLLSERLRAVAQ